MENLRNVYAKKAISQIPRLLGNQDRNPYSPTYGCFHRDYWLDKTSDFPDAVRQFAVHALALVYKHDFPGNIFKGQPKIRDWAIGGLEFWASIQHKDGSFDEFYPFERGWVGPTAFTTYTSIEAYQLLEAEMPEPSKIKIKNAIKKAAYFIIKGDAEEDHLANHHAMACLSIWKAWELLGDEKLKKSYNKVWETFLTYHYADEGWSREYDGVDPGYLSATISFLSKIYKTNPDPAILKVLQESTAFSAYFVYPNGFYAGSMGSRNTLHFYPHGYEVISKEVPLAKSVAEKMLKGLSQDKLVPPEIISDRYVVYRVPEFLLAYLDYSTPEKQLPLLPFEQEPFSEYFERSRIFVSVVNNKYVIANMAKGGVIKVFDRHTEKLLLNDCGIIGELADGKVVTSQWVDPTYQCSADNKNWEVEGKLNVVPSNKLFTPFKNIIFRAALIFLGWSPKLAHWMKGRIRKTLIMGQKKVPVAFKRRMEIKETKVVLSTEIILQKKIKFKRLSIGDEFFVRYVPQSRYFQSQELETRFGADSSVILSELQKNGRFIHTTEIE